MSEPAEIRDDYEAIEQAVLDSPRGRWFLAEYARRNRALETDRLLEAIDRLYNAATKSAVDAGAGVHLDLLHRDLEDMRQSIATMRCEIAAIRPRDGLNLRAGNVAQDPESIAVATERATLDILAAVERLQAIGEQLRKRGADSDLCDEIETHARGIFMASSFQDMTGQRMTRLVTALRYLEQRLDALLSHPREAGETETMIG